MHRSSLSALVVAMAVLGSHPVFAVTLMDGGFEQPVFVGGFFDYDPNSPTSGQSPWTFGGNGSGIQRPPSAFSPTAAPEGGQVAFLQAGTTITSASICQNVAGFSVGSVYLVSFQFAGRAAQSAVCPQCDGGNPFELRADGVPVQTFTPQVLETYVPGSATFRAGGTTVSICFVGLGVPLTDDVTSFIDDVQISLFATSAPLLGGWAMMMLAALLLSFGVLRLWRVSR